MLPKRGFFDDKEIQNLRALFKTNPRPFTIDIDFSEIGEFNIRRGTYEEGETIGRRKHTLLTYFILPLIFDQAIKTKRMQIHSAGGPLHLTIHGG